MCAPSVTNGEPPDSTGRNGRSVTSARALVDWHDARTRVVDFNDRLEAFARYSRFRPRACAPYQARTKGKDERGVGYEKPQCDRGHGFDSWGTSVGTSGLVDA